MTRQATFRQPRAFHELLFAAGDDDDDGDGPIDPPRPDFVTEFVYPPDAIERSEFLIEPGGGWPAERMDAFLRLDRVAYGKEVSAHQLTLRVRGFLPVVRAAWQMATLATAN